MNIYLSRQCKTTFETSLTQLAGEDIINSWADGKGRHHPVTGGMNIRRTSSAASSWKQNMVYWFNNFHILNLKYLHLIRDHTSYTVHVWINNLPKVHEIYGSY